MSSYDRISRISRFVGMTKSTSFLIVCLLHAHCVDAGLACNINVSDEASCMNVVSVDSQRDEVRLHGTFLKGEFT